jgi:hypothetical protein
MKTNRINRRAFLEAGAAAAAGAALSRLAIADPSVAPHVPVIEPVLPRADSMIFIWLPGGMAQTDMWDPKKFTPYRQGMRGNEFLGTCESIPTSADGIRLGAGLEHMASVMHKGTIVRTLSSDVKFGAIHLKAQYYAMTGFLFPNSVKAPSIGAIVGRTRGRRDPNVPAYIYIGRDIDTSDAEKLFISEYIGPGFYGVNHAPFMIPDPSKGMQTLNAYGNMDIPRLDRRQAYLKKLCGLEGQALEGSGKVSDYMKVMEAARAMMDSPVKKAFDYRTEEKPQILAAYQPQIEQKDLLETDYFYGNRFGESLLLARRLVERGARFVQVEYQYGPFKGFDMHYSEQRRMQEMKKQVDRPIARLIKDLDERGLLDRTLVVIASEFGRTIASEPSAGKEPDGFAERNTGANLVIDNEKMYGFHGHFSSTCCQLFFGGGFKGGHVHGKTAPEHPMAAIEDPITLTDLRATIYKAMGIAANQYYLTEGRPFYVTDNGKGQAADTLLA